MRKALYFILSFSLISCVFDKFDNKYITINNDSNNCVYYIISYNDIMFDYEKLLMKQRLDKGEEMSRIDITGLYISDSLAKKSYSKYKGPMDWKSYINMNVDKKMRLFIIKKDSVDKYGWEYVHNKNIFNKKYLYTFKELEKINWVIKYDDK